MASASVTAASTHNVSSPSEMKAPKVHGCTDRQKDILRICLIVIAVAAVVFGGCALGGVPLIIAGISAGGAALASGGITALVQYLINRSKTNQTKPALPTETGAQNSSPDIVASMSYIPKDALSETNHRPVRPQRPDPEARLQDFLSKQKFAKVQKAFNAWATTAKLKTWQRQKLKDCLTIGVRQCFQSWKHYAKHTAKQEAITRIATAMPNIQNRNVILYPNGDKKSPIQGEISLANLERSGSRDARIEKLSYQMRVNASIVGEIVLSINPKTASVEILQLQNYTGTEDHEQKFINIGTELFQTAVQESLNRGFGGYIKAKIPLNVAGFFWKQGCQFDHNITISEENAKTLGLNLGKAPKEQIELRMERYYKEHKANQLRLDKALSLMAKSRLEDQIQRSLKLDPACKVIIGVVLPRRQSPA